VSVVVPVFENAERLRELSIRLARVLDDPYELLFVDDASPDNARAVVRALAAADPHVCGLCLAENVGQNAAVVAGLAHARGDIVVVMDGDLQDPPEAVPVLVRELTGTGVHAVFAGRRGRYESIVRLVGSRALKRLLWLLTAGRLPPDAGLFLGLDRATAERVCASAGSNPYVGVLVARAAGRVASVPVERASSRSSAYTGRMRIRVAFDAVAAAFPGTRGSHPYRVTERIGL
jgi:glycosyltransferase involved in cell wall biosynthesis